jgi:hypothetical protein
VRQAAIDLVHRKRLMMRKANRRSDHVSATNQVARELLDGDNMLVDKVIVTKDSY